MSRHHSSGPSVWRSDGAAALRGRRGPVRRGGRDVLLGRARGRARPGPGPPVDGRLRRRGARRDVRARGVSQRLPLGLPLRLPQRLSLRLPQRVPLGLSQRLSLGLRLGRLALTPLMPTPAEAAGLRFLLPLGDLRLRARPRGSALRGRPRRLVPRPVAARGRRPRPASRRAPAALGPLPDDGPRRRDAGARGRLGPGRGRVARACERARKARRTVGHDALGPVQRDRLPRAPRRPPAGRHPRLPRRDGARPGRPLPRGRGGAPSLRPALAERHAHDLEPERAPEEGRGPRRRARGARGVGGEGLRPRAAPGSARGTSRSLPRGRAAHGPPRPRGRLGLPGRAVPGGDEQREGDRLPVPLRGRPRQGGLPLPEEARATDRRRRGPGDRGGRERGRALQGRATARRPERRLAHRARRHPRDREGRARPGAGGVAPRTAEEARRDPPGDGAPRAALR